MILAQLHEIEQAALMLPLHERRLLLERLNRSIKEQQPRAAPQDLYGVWRERFPESFDLDSALHDLRSAWQQDDAARIDMSPTRTRCSGI